MGWRDVLKKEIRIPGIPEGWTFPAPSHVPFIGWYAQQFERDRRAVLTQIAAIVSTNAPLPEGLRVCAEDAPNRFVRSRLRDLAGRIDSGRSLGEAMMISGGLFKQEWIGLVLAGERTGSLHRALDSILDDLNTDIGAAELQRNRIAYFSFLIVTQAGIVTFITMRITPVFMEIFTEFSVAESRSLALFHTLNRFLSVHVQVLLGLTIAGIVFATIGPLLFRLSGFIQFLTTHALLPLPIVGAYYRFRVLESLASILQLLCKGGMPLPEALRHASRGGLPQPFGRALKQISESVERGSTLSEAFTKHRYLFGARFIEFIKFGEGSEDLAGAFAQARDLFRRRVLRRRRALTDALVPAGVAICGSGVLLASISVYAMLAALADSIIAEL